MRAIRVILYDAETPHRFMNVYRSGLKEGKSYQIRDNDGDVFAAVIQDFSLPAEPTPNWNGIVITPSRVIYENDPGFTAILELLTPKGDVSDESV